MQRLEELRAQLQHFEQSPDFGDADAVDEIRQHLLLRMREAEGMLQTKERLVEGEKAARVLSVFEHKNLRTQEPSKKLNSSKSHVV